MPVAITRLAALRDYLVLLATAPAPTAVAAGLAAPGLLPLRARSTALWIVVDHRLTRIATFDEPSATGLRPLLDILPLSGNDPTARAALSAAIVRSHAPNPEAPARLRVPIVFGGLVTGVFAADGLPDGPLTADDITLLDAVADSTALWLDHRSEATSVARTATSLTHRQQQVLMLVLAGSTNASIAAALGCSSATVKVELLTVNRLLGTSDRRAAATTAHELGLLVPDGAR